MNKEKVFRKYSIPHPLCCKLTDSRNLIKKKLFVRLLQGGKDVYVINIWYIRRLS